MNFQPQSSMQQKPITIILFGRTGSGKSYLANKLAGRRVFEEGESLHSQTSLTASHLASLPGFPHIKIKIIDTPGFADNRPDMPQEQLLANILCFLQELGDGFHIGIYCVPVKSRADNHDIQEMRMIGTLLGQEVFQHTLIAVTQANTLIREERQKVYMKFPIDLPQILSIASIGPKQILFADGDDQFQERFVNRLAKFAETASIYQPQIAQDIDPQDPQSIKKALASPEIQQYMKEYEALLEEQKKQIVEIKGHLDKQITENQALHKKSLEDQKMHQDQINYLDKQLQQSNISNKQLAEQYRVYREEQVQELDKINQQVISQQNRLEQNQQLVDQRDQEIAALTEQVRGLESTRMAAANSQKMETEDDDDDQFWKPILKHTVNGILGVCSKAVNKMFKSRN